MVHYTLPHGKRCTERLYPKRTLLGPATRKQLDLKTYADVVHHFTASLLSQDRIAIVDGSLQVELHDEHDGYSVSFDPAPGFEGQAAHFADMPVAMLDEEHFGLALKGADAAKRTPAWNQMASYPVNPIAAPGSGESEYPNDKLTICALAQMDLCFDPVKIAPMYTFDEAKARCQAAEGKCLTLCFGCKPLAAA